MPLPTQPTSPSPSPERFRAVITSPGGYGKTELAAGWFPQTTLHLDLDNGTHHLDTPGFREPVPNYDTFSSLVNELCAGNHHYKAVIIDTGDKLVRLADQAAARSLGKTSASEVEYGKGLGRRDAMIFRDLAKLMATDLGVLLLTHSIKVTNTDAMGAETTVRYPRIESGQEGDRLRQPIIGEFEYVLHIEKRSENERVLITGGDPGYETKRRRQLADVIPLPKGQGAEALYAALMATFQPKEVAA